MACEGERRRHVAVNCVAFLAAVQIGRGCELSLVHVVMTIEAMRSWQIEYAIITFRNVALLAVDIRMFSGEGILRSSVVIFYAEG